MTRQQRNDAIDSSYSARRQAQNKAIADAARKAGDKAMAAFWDGQVINPDYSQFPPGMTRLRLLEIAGTLSADAPVRSDEGNAYLRGVLVQHLIRIIRCAESPELRLDAIDEDATTSEKIFARGLIRAAGGRDGELRIDAAESKLKDDWDNQASRPPSATRESATRAVTALRSGASVPDESKATRTVDRQDASPTSSWDGQWKQPPRSDVFAAGWKQEPARGGGLAVGDVVNVDEKD
jgi:hypothetical protein